MTRPLAFALAFGLAAVGLAHDDAHAQSYPNKPVRLIVPFAAGGAVDVLARLLGTKLSEAIGQPMLVENRAGAGGNLGADAVAKSPPDGYTILQTPNGMAITPALYRSLPFDAVKDFTPVTQLVSSTLILVASPHLKIASTRELIALAKFRPGRLNYGSSGIGNPLHLTMEMFKHAAGIDILAVPYRGDAQINAALIAGEVEVAVVPLATARPLVEGGQLRALAVTGALGGEMQHDPECRHAEGNCGDRQQHFDRRVPPFNPILPGVEVAGSPCAQRLVLFLVGVAAAIFPPQPPQGARERQHRKNKPA